MHVVFVTAPTFGHALPVLQLAYKSANAGVISSFIATDIDVISLGKAGELERLSHENLRIISLPHEGNLSDLSDKGTVLKLYFQMIEPTKTIIGQLARGEEVYDVVTKRNIPATVPPRNIVGSPFIFFGPPIARGHGMKWTTLISMSVIGAVVTLRIAADAIEQERAGNEEVILNGVNIPGYMDVKASEMIYVFGEQKLKVDSPSVWLFRGVAELVERSDYLLVNTTETFDKALFPFLSSTIPIYPVGPLCSSLPTGLAAPELTAFLDRHVSRSVVYIAMGSADALSDEEEAALADGLAKTQVSFVWVRCRTTSVADDDELRQGIFIDWINQRAVLDHPAIGLFFSHGGWNSVLESLSSGVPMLLRPFHAEHTLNARQLEEKLHVGKRFDPASLAAELGDFAFGSGEWKRLGQTAEAIAVDLEPIQGGPMAGGDKALLEWIDAWKE